MATGGNLDENPAEHRELSFSEKVSRNLCDNRPMFIRYLRCTECLSGVTGVIDGFDHAFASKVRRVMKIDGQEDANEIFLQRLEESRDKGKWNTFIFTLQQQDYEMLVRLLAGEPVNSHREQYVKVVELLTSVIIHKMDPVAMLPYLVREGCLNHRDKQNIECAKKELGNIDATELLLSRVTRLKDDWFLGFMTALRCVGMTDLMTEIDPDYTEKMLAEPDKTCSSSESTELSALDNKSGQSDGATPTSPDSLDLKTLDELSACKDSERDDLPFASRISSSPLRDYQKEWHESVSTGQNTLLLGPRQSGKTFVTLKLIQEHLSSAESPDRKVAYVSTDPQKLLDMWVQSRSFLRRGITMVIQGSWPSNQRLDEILQEHSFLLMSGNSFHCALKEGTVGCGHFSLVIVELGVDYFCQDKHVYKQMMPYFHQLKAGSDSKMPSPQILVLSTSVCGTGKETTDMFGVAMDTCADFTIVNTTMVETTVGSLRNFVPFPLAERTPVPDQGNNEFSQTVEELMSHVEKDMEKKHASLGQKQDLPVPKMSELSKAPADRKSVKYMAWLKTNTATLIDIVSGPRNNRSAEYFLSCFKLLQLFQDALFISMECRSLDGIQYVEEKMKSVLPWTTDKATPPKPLARLTEHIYEILTTLRDLCTSEDYEDPVIEALKEKLKKFYADKRHKKVVILVKHPVAVLSVCRYLDGVAGMKCKCFWTHDKVAQTSAHLRNGFDVLVTTWPLLVHHFPGSPRYWDCIIRTDCPYNGFVAWEHQAQLEKPEVSRFSTDEETSTFEVDLLLESTIESTTMELINLQRNFTEEYNSALTNIQTSKAERRSWARYNYEIEQAFMESNVDLFCRGCGKFVCNETYIRNLDRLRLCLDQNVIHKLKTIKHPEQIVFDDGYAKLGRFVCKHCGQKWGIVVYVLLKPHLVFSKEGLDVFNNGCYIPYCRNWQKGGVNSGTFQYNRDLLRCLPSTFCVDGEPIADLLRRLPKASEA